MRIENNGLSDLSGLEGLSSLIWLYLGNNKINNLSPLSGLEIQFLEANDNQISDLSPLMGLADNLTRLFLRRNQISVLGGTFDNWTNHTYIDLNENPLICSEIDAARQNGNIDIDFYTECYEDRDGDGVPDYKDAFPDDASVSVDTDGDGLPDTCNAECLNAGYTEDLDDDGDGVSDAEDAFPLSRYATADSDGDGAPDELLNLDPEVVYAPFTQGGVATKSYSGLVRLISLGLVRAHGAV